MEWFVKAFIRASLAWFTLGIALGLAIAAYPPWVAYRPAHAHMTVVGFLTMMVFGVGYQLLPRLFGGHVHSRRMAIAHWWLANGGLAAMVTGFLLAPSIGTRSAPVTATGGALFSAGAFLFVYNLWRTFNAAEARLRARAQTSGPARPLPTVQED
ncbi:MAG: cbb3-type cytochrome c oxidase subunit I [Gemmatimonadaceae bacterium]